MVLETERLYLRHLTAADRPALCKILQDERAMYASLRRLFDLPGETRVYPGHGGATTIGAEKGRYRL